jgi:hypothetical protein
MGFPCHYLSVPHYHCNWTPVTGDTPLQPHNLTTDTDRIDNNIICGIDKSLCILSIVY